MTAKTDIRASIMDKSQGRNLVSVLDAELHEAYDPSTEFKEGSGYISSVPFSERKTTGAEDAQFKPDSIILNNDGSGIPMSAARGVTEDSAGNSASAYQPDAGQLMNGNGASADALSGNRSGSLGSEGFNAEGGSGLGDGGTVAPVIRGESPSVSSSSSSTTTINNPPSNPPAPPVPGPLIAPDVSLTSGPAAENQPINLTITAATDPDPAVVTTYVLTGIPAGAHLSAGILNPDGSYTLTSADLPGLQLIPAPYSSGVINLSLTATSMRGTETASDTEGEMITVAGVATTPNLSVSNVTGAEDTAIPLMITSSLVDTDGSETLSLRISGIPAGASLSAGTNIGGGTWQLTPAQLAGLTLTPATNMSGTINLNVSAISSEAGTTATATTPLMVTVTGVADTPNLSLTPAGGAEDTTIALNISASLTDTDGSETLTITISGVPANASLSAGTNLGGGIWQLTPAQLTGLSLTPAANMSGTINLTITATSSEAGTTATSTSPLLVTITNAADTPSLSVLPATGLEDTPIPLSITAALADTDGSEVMTITIAGVPAGASLSAGTDLGGGVWQLTPAQLSGLTLTPVANMSGTLNLTVSATSTEAGTSATSTSSMTVTVAGVADAPVVTAPPAAGVENTPVALNISASLSDTDGSESLTITISGVPAGASLSAGTNMGGGIWQLTPAQLTGLMYNPAPNTSGLVSLSISATASENGTSATTTINSSITVGDAADVPSLNVGTVTGAEDTPIALSITAALTDAGGGETLTVLISGIPAGASLSAGTNLGGGNWSLTEAQVPGVTLIPAANMSGTISLTITATASENGTTASASSPMSVIVTGVADTPTLAVAPASGAEDTAIPLSIIAALTDTDGSETLSILISNVPAGALLSAGINNGNGSWSLSPAQLGGLTLTPPANWSGTINLSVAATASENGTHSTVTSPLALTVNGTVDAPVLLVHDVTGAEDTPIILNIQSSLADFDGSETLSVTISGVPLGANLSAGINLGGGVWSLSEANLVNLTLTPPLNWSGLIPLSVTVTASENGFTQSVSDSFNLTVTGVADAPNLNVAPASGLEDTPIALNITSSLVDNDGSETLSIVIGNLPPGSILSAGTQNPDGTWTLQPAQLTGLTITPPQHISGVVNISVVAISSEGSSSNATSLVLPLTINGTASSPTLVTQPATGTEDNNISLTISGNLNDVGGTEILTFLIDNLPTGASLSAGTDNGDGSWSLSESDIIGLQLIPPANWSGIVTLSVTAISTEGATSSSTMAPLVVTVTGVADIPSLAAGNSTGNEDTSISLTLSSALTDLDGSENLTILVDGLPAGAALSAGIQNPDNSWTLTQAQLSGLAFIPPANWSGAVTLSITATASEDGTTATASASFSVTVAGIVDTPSLSLMPANGIEDIVTPLVISANSPDNDGSETLSILIGNIPAGFSLSAGTNNGNGSWTLIQAQLSGLTLAAPANWSGTLSLSVAVTAVENGVPSTISASLPVTITGVADVPLLSVTPVSGNEDTAIALNISASLTDTDGSENLALSISGVPAGATLSAGTNMGGGIWHLTAAQLSGLTLTPPQHWSGTINLNVSATASENGTNSTVTSSLAVSVGGVADAPLLSASPASGNEDAVIALNITSAFVDTDGSETMTIVISGLPAGSILSAGINNGNGSWTLTPAQLAGLTLTPPSHLNGAFNLIVTATTSENGTTASSSTNLPVTIQGIANTPALSVAATATGSEDTAIPLSISAALTDSDGSERLSIVISGVPAGATLSAGHYAGAGKWSLSAADLVGLTLTPPPNFAGVIALQVNAISTENDGATTMVSAPCSVNVTAVADAPFLQASAITANEDIPFTLNISSLLLDTDGSETLSVVISGVPAGASLSAGINNGNGSWTLLPAQLTGLTMTLPAHRDNDFTLLVTATATESTGSSAQTTTSVPVTVLAVADTPSVSASNSSGAKNTQVAVNISGAIGADADGSESLTYIIDGVPDGFRLNHGINNGDNSWTLTPAQLAGLTIISPYNFEGRIHLTATSVSHDNDNSTATSLPVSFNVGIGNASGGIQINLGLGIGVAGIGVGVGIGIGVNLGGLLDPAGIVIMEDTIMPLPDAGLLANLVANISFVTLAGLPVGASLSAGTNLGGGIWQLLPGQLTGLSLIAPPNSDEDFTITITARVLGIITVGLATTLVHVIGVADVPTLSVANATGNEDGGPIAISVTSTLTDTDGSETLTFVIKDLPPGFVPTVGINNGDGSWSLSAAQIASLAITPPAHFSGDATYTIVAISTEREGDSSIHTVTGNIHVNAAADAPQIVYRDIAGTEDSSTSLNFGIALSDTDGSEQISAVTITGVPAGFVLTHATDNGGGSWSIDPAHMNQSALLAPQHWSGDLTLTLSATSRETSNGTTSTITVPVSVHISGVADTPLGTASDAHGTAGTSIALNLTAALTDADGSEHLSIVISGMEAGSYLSAGLNNGDGTWTLTQNQLAGLSYTSSEGFSGDDTLTMTVFSIENNASVASDVNPFTVHVDPA